MRVPRISRRVFLKQSGIAVTSGLTLGSALSGCSDDQSNFDAPAGWHVWLTIASDNSITVFCPRMEMGQGILNSFGQLAGRELDADMAFVLVRHAPLNLEFGSQITENSDSIRTHWRTMRQLGADARDTLIRAAAKKWGVVPDACTTNSGVVVHSVSGRRAEYGELSSLAKRLVPSSGTPLRSFNTGSSAREFRDLPTYAGLVNAGKTYVADISLPGMLSAALITCPRVGGRVAAIDKSAAVAAIGVEAVVDLDTAVAVVADTYWTALKATRLVNVAWLDDTPYVPDHDDWKQRLQDLNKKAGSALLKRGEAEGRLSTDSAFERVYWSPYDAHAALETTTCVADVRPNSCEVWAPTQSPWSTYAVARDNGLSAFNRFRERVSLKLSGTANNRVIIHSTPMGGSFGRRLQQDHVEQAVRISRAVGKPVKLQWSREQDMSHDFFRPASSHNIRATVDEKGQINAWRHRIAGSGILDHGSASPYDCDHELVEVTILDAGLPTGSLRSTSHSPNAFARECFIDELAAKLGIDPYVFRLLNLKNNSRLGTVLTLAAEAAGRGDALTTGWARGIAVHPSKGSFVAMVAEINADLTNGIRVERIVCAVDCGVVINESSVRAQLEGAIIFGLTSTLKSRITVRKGEVQQSNFHDYPLLRMNETPRIEIHLLASDKDPGGVGEVGVPCVAPAVANALFAASGQRVRELPLSQGLVLSDTDSPS